MAGVVFKSETHVLMGYKLHDGIITGIGGKPIGDEVPIRTAFREAVEEIFGIQPEPSLLAALVSEFSVRGMAENKGYKMFILTLDDLLVFMRIVRDSARVSPFYHSFPSSLEDLILTRRAPKSVEIVSLALLPITPDHYQVDQRDMRTIL
jgi:hypothetical protein